MKSNKRFWALTMAGALAISNLSAIATPFGGLTALAAGNGDKITFKPGDMGAFDNSFVAVKTVGEGGITDNTTLPGTDAWSAVPAGAKEGYHLEWSNGKTNYDPATATYKDVATAVTDGNVTTIKTAELTATSVADEFTISQNLDGKGTNPDDIEKTFGTPLSSAIIDPQYEGYTFTKWNLGGNPEITIASGAKAADQSTAIDNRYKQDTTSPVTMTAVWSIDEYEITYDANAGTGSIDPGKYTVTTGQTLPSSGVSRTGYTLEGWSTIKITNIDTFNPDVNTTRDFRTGATFGWANVTQPKNVKLYAVWGPADLTVQFNANGGTGTMTDQTIKAGKPTSLKQNEYTNEGYTFIGWGEDASATEVKYADKASVTITESDELFAIWKANELSITFDANGGENEMPDQKVEAGKAATLNKNLFAKTGYTFGGWSLTKDGNKEKDDEASITITKNTTLYAIWNPGKYTVKFDKNGGEGQDITDQQITYDTATPLTKNTYTAPAGTSYTFKGWAKNKNAKVADYADEESVKNLAVSGKSITLYAVWERGATSDIDFYYEANSGEGNVPADRNKTLPYTTKANTVFTKRGYDLIGWDLDPDETEPTYGCGTKITAVDSYEVTLYAIWKAQECTAIFDANGGTGEMENQTFMYGSGDNLNPNTFTYADHEFKGWSLTASGTVKYEDKAPIDDKDITIAATGNKLILYAQWEEVDPSKIVALADAADAAAKDAAAKAADAKTKAALADAAAKAADKNATDDTVKAARDAAQAARDAAQAADDAAVEAEAAAVEAEAAAKTTTNKAALDAVAAAREAVDQATEAAENEAKAARDAAKLAEDAADAAEQKMMSKEEAIAEANAAAEKAVKDPTDANIQAAKDAVKLAESKGATAADLKSANDKIAQAEEANKAAKEAADGSAANTPAPVGTELVDANGNKTGFKVTDANASAPEVEYEAPADKNATKADIPETYTDLSGNVYKVVGIDARAFKDTKVKTVTIRKNIKRIDPKAFEKSKVKNVKIKGTKLTKKMAKSFKKLKKGGKITCSGSHKKKNKEILNNLSTVKNGKTKVK